MSSLRLSRTVGMYAFYASQRSCFMCVGNACVLLNTKERTLLVLLKVICVAQVHLTRFMPDVYLLVEAFISMIFVILFFFRMCQRLGGKI